MDGFKKKDDKLEIILFGKIKKDFWKDQVKNLTHYFFYFITLISWTFIVLTIGRYSKKYNLYY